MSAASLQLHEKSDPYNPEKFIQVLHYIIHKTSGYSNVGKKVLFKLLYFSDFDFYELHETHLTGERYSKIDHGPAPNHFGEVVKRLEKEGKVKEIHVKYHGKSQIRYISLDNPDIGLLNGNELTHLEQTLCKYSTLNGAQIEAISHEDLPWKASSEKKEIDYELVFYRDARTSVRDYPDD